MMTTDPAPYPPETPAEAKQPAGAGCPATSCSALVEVDYYVSPCGKFHGCSDDYTEMEWEEILAGDNVIVFAGTTVESARSQLRDAGLQESEVEELIPLPNSQDRAREA